MTKLLKKSEALHRSDFTMDMELPSLAGRLGSSFVPKTGRCSSRVSSSGGHLEGAEKGEIERVDQLLVFFYLFSVDIILNVRDCGVVFGGKMNNRIARTLHMHLYHVVSPK